MIFNKVDFISAFAISFSDRTLQFRFLSGLVCGEQDLFKTKCSEEKCNLQHREMDSKKIAQSMVKRNAISIVAKYCMPTL